MSGYYLDHKLPVFDGEEFDKFIRNSDQHFEEMKKCKYWKRVINPISGNLSFFNDCHNPLNKTKNCHYNLCPIRKGYIYIFED